ncbi:serine hydrolase [Microlunatus elymi]|uniref:Serine hydrolase n=1 Tax=Microlunatus elymi TaxID=2596828 RepID=A0A516Q071_9ACTN|nr:serine hydrolase [Microlunatus elymi]QDP96818.1 serine hydrolase [Microlunatus elymi]
MTPSDHELIFDESTGISWSAFAVDLESDQTLFSHSPERELDTASIGKIFLLHTLLDQVDRGERTLEERVRRRPSEWMNDSGLWYRLQADELSLYDVAALIGAVSDNAATNTLCRVIGLDVVHEHTAALGYRHSGLDDVVRWPRPPGAPSRLSHGTAAELTTFVAALARNETLSAASCDTFKRWLGAGMDLSMVASAFGLDPLAHDEFDRGIWLWNKTGTISRGRADIGVVMSPERRIAYAVLANWPRGDDRRDQVLEQMRSAGNMIKAHVQDDDLRA